MSGPLKGEAGIQFVIHLRCLVSQRYVAEQLISLFSRNSAVEVKALKGPSFIPSRPTARSKVHRYNSKQFVVVCNEWPTQDRAVSGSSCGVGYGAKGSFSTSAITIDWPSRKARPQAHPSSLFTRR